MQNKIRTIEQRLDFLNWWQKLRRRGPKAKIVTPLGDHIENLATHPMVDIQRIGETIGLPVWVDVPPEVPTTTTYDGLVWEVEPMGEYLYFLAGRFPKNEKGLLRYGSAGTIAEVHVCFEDDVISVDRADMEKWSEAARKKATDSSDFIGMRVGDISAFAHDRTQSAGFERYLASLALKNLHGGQGYMEQATGFHPRPQVGLYWSKHSQTSHGIRVTKVIVQSTDSKQQFGPLHDLFKALIERYQDIDDHPLSGAIRM